MSDEAFRVLGAAYREYPADSDLKELELEQELVFIGALGMIDPPRLEVVGPIEGC